MKSRIFRHYTDTFCKKFLGYCIFSSASDFQKNGSGTYHFDFKNRVYKFESSERPKLAIALEIQRWFDEKLKTDAGKIDEIKIAELTVNCLAPGNIYMPAQGSYSFVCRARINYRDKVYESTERGTNSDLDMVSS